MMTLKYLTNEIEKIAINEQLVNYSKAGSSIAELNPQEVIYYPVLFIAPTGTHRVTENTTEYAITLYFFDRLLQDNTNAIDIYSVAVEELKNLIIEIRTIEGVLDVSERYDIRNFNMVEKLNDRCAGAYAEIRILTDNKFICHID